MVASTALVSLRAAIFAAQAAGRIDRPQCERLVSIAEGTHFARRSVRRLLRDAALEDRDLEDFMTRHPDPKHSDAVLALQTVARSRTELLATTEPTGPAPLARRTRYLGQHRLLGLERTVVEQMLLQWMTGSGRLQRYVWPLMVGEREFDGLTQNMSADRPFSLREGLALALRRLIDEHPEAFAGALFDELDFIDELDAEIAIMAAHPGPAASPAPDKVRYARELVALEQGFRDWAALRADVADGRLYGALPVSWLEDAVARIAAKL